jgi:hypothetical protein
MPTVLAALIYEYPDTGGDVRKKKRVSIIHVHGDDRAVFFTRCGETCDSSQDGAIAFCAFDPNMRPASDKRWCKRCLRSAAVPT